MIRLVRPDAEQVSAVLGRVDTAFGYAEVGMTARPEAFEGLSSRYAIDRRRFPLGKGRGVFENARSALFAWRHFEIPWLELQGAAESAHAGQVVATLTRVFGVWFLNPCRVVDLIDSRDEQSEASFAYGTLAGHVAQGEERFTLRRDPTTDLVVFEILAYSRPGMLLTRLGRPWMRRVQRRFAGDAAEALRRASEHPITR